MVKPFLITQRGALFDGDCLEILPHMHSNIVDCVFADPPFNLGKDYKNGFADAKPAEEYFAWCQRWISECCRVLKPGGALFIYALPELAIRFGNMMNDDMVFRHWIALTMKGTYIRGHRLYPAHYALLYYTKGEPGTFNRLRIPIPTCRHCGKEIKDYGGHRDRLNPDGLNLSDFWEDTSPNRHKKFKVRPGVNELKLMIPERAIRISSNENGLVLDPFGGGGSTYQAAEKHNRNWIGIELYDCAYIQRRLQEQFPASVAAYPGYAWQQLFEIETE